MSTTPNEKKLDEKLSALPVVVIAGPTASGKTALAIKLAEKLNGEIVNADSMQIYRDLPVLTAIPSKQERGDIPHHGYGVFDGGERCSVGRWLELIRKIATDIRGRGRIPILVGGTGMYIRAALFGISSIPDVADDIRQQATALHRDKGGAGFRAELAKHDLRLAERLDDGDTQRLIRGMEVFMATGTPLSQWQEKPLEGKLDAPAVTIKISPPRDELYAMIDKRYPLMLEQGGIEEGEAFLSRGLSPDLPLMKAVGFPPLASYLRGEISRKDAVDIACRDTRRYAKRQTTWFNNQYADNFCEDSSYDTQYSESFINKILSKIIN